jgi:hypothetical protein
MRHKNHVGPAGLLLLLLLRQAHARSEEFPSAALAKSRLDSSAMHRGAKPPIANFRRRLPIDVWQTDSWTKAVVPVHGKLQRSIAPLAKLKLKKHL